MGWVYLCDFSLIAYLTFPQLAFNRLSWTLWRICAIRYVCRAMGAYELAIAELTEEAGEEARERWTDWARRLRRNKRISDILQVGLQPCEEKNLTRARVYYTGSHASSVIRQRIGLAYLIQ